MRDASTQARNASVAPVWGGCDSSGIADDSGAADADAEVCGLSAVGAALHPLVVMIVSATSAAAAVFLCQIFTGPF
jgi:hypothetical protein